VLIKDSTISHRNGAHPTVTTDLQPAAGYVRVSLKRQVDGESPENQRERIIRRAQEEGYHLTIIEEDHDRGGRMTRVGYQKILEAARAGTIHAVFVYSLSRWGRNAAERLARGQELDKLRVKVISVLQGHDRPGLSRAVWAGMDEEYSRQLAANVREAKERSARKGKHQGVTPLGFKRYYPARENSSRYQAGLLMEDPATSWAIKELFSRYGQGGYSLRSLAVWLNGDPALPRSPKGCEWRSRLVHYILRNPVYCGHIRYNQSHFGIYETSTPGSEFVVDGQHEGFIDPDLFDLVQRRLDAGRKNHTYNRLAPHVPLGAGLMRCGHCEGPMIPKRSTLWNDQYMCLRRNNGLKECSGGCYAMAVAHTGLLAEVRRLQGVPWNPAALEHLAEDKEGERMRAKLLRDLARERERKDRNMRLLQRIADPTDDEIAEFRRVGAEISASIKAIEAQLAAVPAPSISIPDLESLHRKLMQTEAAAIVDGFLEVGDEAGLREWLVELVETARVVDRVPANKTKWVRVAVTWTQPVQILLTAGLLTLGPEPERPYQPTTPREYAARKRQRHKEKLRLLAQSRTAGDLQPNVQ
jgi:DNA invertase Pin-like site-specific DNA recombinase